MRFPDRVPRPQRLDFGPDADRGIPITPPKMGAPYVTFVKAAMYLLAETRFSTLRQSMLDDSSLLVQDDTGIPFRYLDDKWATRFFGRYETPGSPFEERAQPNLKAAFERRPQSPLPFGIGYHVLPARSNLLIASKGR